MIKVKIFLIVLGIALVTSVASLFFKVDMFIIGNIPDNTVVRGFPVHFYETSHMGGTNPHEFLIMNFFLDFLVYFVVVTAILYLISLGYKKGVWLPLSISGVIGVCLTIIIVGMSTACVSGFPIEFFLRCKGESDITPGYVLYGWIFDGFFWISLSSILVAFVYKFITVIPIRKSLFYRYAWFTFIDLWLSYIIFSITSDTLDQWFAMVIALVFFLVLFKIFHYFLAKQTREAPKFFFSRVGHIVFTVVLLLDILVTVLNYSYQPGFFDFSDLGLVIASFPLILFTHFQPDSGIFWKRIVLYFIFSSNLVIIVFILDVFLAFCGRFLQSIGNLISRIYVTRHKK